MRRAAARIAIGGVLLVLTAIPVAAQGIVDPQVRGNELTARLELPGGVAADVTLRFESVVGLSVTSPGLSAQLVDPGNLALLARLPSTLVSIPSAFPVLLRVEPPMLEGLSFLGVAALEIHAHNLAFVPGTPLRIFGAPAGGAFVDATADMGAGSYRARSDRGTFSDFLIVADARPLAAVSAGKFAALDSLLDAHGSSMGATLAGDLQALVDQARADEAAGDYVAAAQSIDAFGEAVEAASGTAIPNLWRSRRDVTNVGGLLRSAAATLRFSLALQGGS